MTGTNKEELEELVFSIKLRHAYKDVVSKVTNHTKASYKEAVLFAVETFGSLDVLILAGGVIDSVYDSDISLQVEHQIMLDSMISYISFASVAFASLKAA